MATKPRFRVSLPLPLVLLVLVVFLVLQLSWISTLASPDGSGDGRRDLLDYRQSARRGGGRAGEAAPNCREMRTRSECDRSSRWCRWCRSEDLDDMCFESSEAWRLPQQVFSCDPTS